MNIQGVSNQIDISSLFTTGSNQGTSASSSTSNATGTTTYDVKDLNKDGYVSAQEELMYALMHPNLSETSSQNTLTQYNASGSLNSGGSEASKQIDIFA